MQARWALSGIGIALAACTMPDPDAVTPPPPDPSAYLGIQTRLLDDDLVGFLLKMQGGATIPELSRYGDCAAAQYALIRGYGFARHVRTNTGKEAGLSTADAVYTISREFPSGLRALNAADVVEGCKTDGIPTV